MKLGDANMTQVVGNSSDTDLMWAKEFIINPNYKEVTSDDEFHIIGDIALIILKEPVPQPGHPESWIVTHTTNPGFALLPDPRQYWDYRSFNFFGVAIGWGITENASISLLDGENNIDAADPQRLNEERITFQVAMTPEECSGPMFYGTSQQPNDTFCGAWFGGFEALFRTSNSTVVSSICRGDSGGPLVIPGSVVEPFNFQGDVQIGIVSAGPPCPFTLPPGKVWPAEFVDVSQYVPWIHQQMESRGLTPLMLATSPLRSAYRDQTCLSNNTCYTDNVMAGGYMSGMGPNDTIISGSTINSIENGNGSEVSAGGSQTSGALAAAGCWSRIFTTSAVVCMSLFFFELKPILS